MAVSIRPINDAAALPVPGHERQGSDAAPPKTARTGLRSYPTGRALQIAGSGDPLRPAPWQACVPSRPETAQGLPFGADGKTEYRWPSATGKGGNFDQRKGEGMLSGYLVKGDDGYAVGATDTKTGYTGPSARVYRDDNWLFVNTDDYEGQAMLNWETLPFLIEALQKLQKDHENVA